MRNKKSTVLVTGATGFLGRQIIRSLSNKGVNIVLVVREGKEGCVKLIPEVCRIVSTTNLFAESSEWWSNTCDGIDIIIHAAWYCEPGKYLQSPINIECLNGTLELAKGAALAGVKRFVGIGTCFEYDLNAGILSVDTPLKPSTLYAGAKASVFMSLSQFLPLQNVEFSWCRLFYLYGEGEDDRRLVPYLRLKLEAGEVAKLTSGNQIRDFLDVKVAGKMIVEAGLSDQQGPKNICSGIPITIRQLAEQIADEYGQRKLLKFGAHEDSLTDPKCIVGEF